MRSIKKTKSFVVFLTLIGFFVCFIQIRTVLSAKEPPEQIQINVKSIINNPQNGMSVTLQGNLVRDLGSQRYIFKDQTGDIHVFISDEVMISNAKDPNNKVEIVGVVRAKSNESPNVDVGFIVVKSTYFEEDKREDVFGQEPVEEPEMIEVPDPSFVEP